MPTPLPLRFWSDLSTRDFARLHTAGTVADVVAVLPVAATEQHGPQLRGVAQMEVLSRLTEDAVPPIDASRMLTVGEVARRSGVAASALHFYESKGLIAAVRTSGNQRRYPAVVLRYVAVRRSAPAFRWTTFAPRSSACRTAPSSRRRSGASCRPTGAACLTSASSG